MPNAGDDDVVDPLVRLGGGLPRHDPDRRAACGFRTARRCGHDLTAATRDHNATGLREQPADLLGARLVLGAAPDDGHLCCPHECDATAVGAERRRANGGTLVLGGGFAGSYVAKLLGSRGATIVSQETFMLYTPLLPEAASGTLEPRHTVVPLRQMCRHAELILGTVEALDEQERVVRVASLAEPLEIEYEQLVIALGAVPRIFPVPGLTEHGRGFKDVADAIALRNHVLRRLEIHVRTTLESYDGRTAVLSDGARVPAHTLVWTAGVRANPLLGGLGLPLDDRGRIVIDELLRVRGRENVWALGDCAAVPNTRTPGQLDPPTCQHALRQARRLAKNLVGAPKPYGYRMLGQVATLGRYKGIADVLGVRLRGFPGWFVTRTYHLYQLPLVSRKLRVVADWTTSLFFRRDIAELSGLGHPHRLGE